MRAPRLSRPIEPEVVSELSRRALRSGRLAMHLQAHLRMSSQDPADPAQRVPVCRAGLRVLVVHAPRLRRGLYARLARADEVDVVVVHIVSHMPHGGLWGCERAGGGEGI